jgi:glycosyltransferase involved in cell wall biosynthesis
MVIHLRFNKLKNKPIVSVIMTAYNSEKFILESINSVLNQTNSDFELILINDASTDNTEKIIKKQLKLDKRIKYFKNKNNLGPAASRNFALKKSQGKYIAILDSDDISNPFRHEKQIKFLEDYQSIFLVASNAEIIDENNKKINILTPITNDKKLAKILPNKNRLYHSSVMFRNDGNTLYREKFIFNHDYDLFLQLLLKGKSIHIMKDVLVKYRKNSTGITSSNYVKQGLFGEIAKTFYKENLKYHCDSYDKFDPNDIMNINVENNYSKNVLIIRIREKSKQRDLNNLLNLSLIYTLNYGINFEVINRLVKSFLMYPLQSN